MKMRRDIFYILLIAFIMLLLFRQETRRADYTGGNTVTITDSVPARLFLPGSFFKKDSLQPVALIPEGAEFLAKKYLRERDSINDLLKKANVKLSFKTEVARAEFHDTIRIECDELNRSITYASTPGFKDTVYERKTHFVPMLSTQFQRIQLNAGGGMEYCFDDRSVSPFVNAGIDVNIVKNVAFTASAEARFKNDSLLKIIRAGVKFTY